MNIKNLFLLLIAALLFACKPELDEVTTTAGSADFSKYVAIGNSLTAGFTDSELFISGQENSYPSILANQMLAVGGGEFKQPMMIDEYGFGRRMLLNAAAQRPVSAGVPVNPANFNSIAGYGPFNNMGVPGAKSFNLIPGSEAFSQLNPYYSRFAAQPGVSTILGEAVAQNPTFFTVWIGNNDVLFYAYSGGASDSITSPALYQVVMGAILQQLTTNGAKGAVANIPDITTIPYFSFMNTQLPYNGLVLNQSQAAALTFGYTPLNNFIKMMGSTDTLVFKEGPNPFVIADKDLPWGIRQMESGELFLLTLPTDSIINNGYGSLTPMPDRYLLTQAEIDRIRNATDSYNNILMTLANQFDLAYVDTKALMTKVATTEGLTVDGIKFTSAYVTGNTFSLDGVHLTGRASAIVANEFIKSINAKYGSNLQEVSPLYYSGLYYY